MRHTVDPAIESVLREALAADEGVLPFARAVVLHLSRPPSRRRDPAAVAAAVIEALDTEAQNDEPARAHGAGTTRWAEDPELLASFFQNADLLDPRDPRTGRLAARVMAALERMRVRS